MAFGQAWVFAGHGSQYPGMGRGFAFDAAEVRPIFAAAEHLSGLPLRELSQQADAQELCRPVVLEPLLAAFSLAYAARLRARGHRPRAVAGYSAGLVPALACADVLNLDDALTLAVRRGIVLEAAARKCQGAMLVVSGLPAARIIGVLQALHGVDQLDVAGWNAPTHLTLAGPCDVLQAAAAALDTAGAKTLTVPAAGAWHSRRCAGLAGACTALTDGLTFHRPRVPVYSSVSAQREDNPGRLRRHLGEQIEAPVYWQATLANLCAGEEVCDVIEASCGRTLAGLPQGPQGPRITSAAAVFSNPSPQLKAHHA